MKVQTMAMFLKTRNNTQKHRRAGAARPNDFLLPRPNLPDPPPHVRVRREKIQFVRKWEMRPDQPLSRVAAFSCGRVRGAATSAIQSYDSSFESGPAMTSG
jgi:hypothetical protein